MISPFTLLRFSRRGGSVYGHVTPIYVNIIAYPFNDSLSILVFFFLVDCNREAIPVCQMVLDSCLIEGHRELR